GGWTWEVTKNRDERGSSIMPAILYQVTERQRRRLRAERHLHSSPVQHGPQLEPVPTDTYRSVPFERFRGRSSCSATTSVHRKRCIDADGSSAARPEHAPACVQEDAFRWAPLAERKRRHCCSAVSSSLLARVSYTSSTAGKPHAKNSSGSTNVVSSTMRPSASSDSTVRQTAW